MITIKIRGIEKLSKKFEGIPKRLTSELNRAIQKSIFQIEAETKPITPVDTGRLRASIGGGVYRGGMYPKGFGTQFKTLYGMIGSDVEYAIFVHERKARHTIGDWKFLERGAKKTTPKIRRFFENAINRALR